jgi:hypothetical protein
MFGTLLFIAGIVLLGFGALAQFSIVIYGFSLSIATVGSILVMIAAYGVLHEMVLTLGPLWFTMLILVIGIFLGASLYATGYLWLFIPRLIPANGPFGWTWGT